jgi:hypothetical protein
MDALHGRKKSHYILKKTGAKQTERVFSAMCLSIAVAAILMLYGHLISETAAAKVLASMKH